MVGGDVNLDSCVPTHYSTRLSYTPRISEELEVAIDRKPN